MLYKLADHLLKKKWSEQDIERYVGVYSSAYLTYAKDDHIRSNAASGGTTTAMLIHGLENGKFDGAVICNTILEEGNVRAHFTIATSRDEIIAAQGSKYVKTRFTHEVLPLIRGFDGKVAVVGLPCNIKSLKRRCKNENALSAKIVLTFALFCGHNSRVELIDEITRRIQKEAGKKLVDYRFRVGLWRGHLEAKFEDGTFISKPTNYFNVYQNLHFFSERKCMACHDHYGYLADISVGDVWQFRLKDNPVKHTGLIARTLNGQTACDDAFSSQKVQFEKLDIRDIMDGQSRTGPSHYNVSARCKAGKILGVKLKDSIKQKVSWNSYLNALLTLVNIQLSEKQWGRKLIFSIPKPILRAYLYFKKGLESIK